MPIMIDVEKNPFFFLSIPDISDSQILETAGGTGKFMFSVRETGDEGISPFTLVIDDKKLGVQYHQYCYDNKKNAWRLTAGMMRIPGFNLPGEIKNLAELQDSLIKQGYEGIPSAISKAICAAIKGNQKEAAIVDMVFERKINLEQVLVLRLDQMEALVNLVLRCDELLEPVRNGFNTGIIFNIRALSENEVLKLGYPLVKGCEKYFSITVKDLNKLIPVTKPPSAFLESLRKLLILPDKKMLSETVAVPTASFSASTEVIDQSFTPMRDAAAVVSLSNRVDQNGKEKLAGNSSGAPKLS